MFNPEDLEYSENPIEFDDLLTEAYKGEFLDDNIKFFGDYINGCSIETIKLEPLLDNENIDAQDNDGCTDLMSAIYSHDIKKAKRLLDSGANLDIQDNDGRTALILALRNDTELPEILLLVKLLLDNGANVDIQDNNGVTVLIQAIYLNDPKLVKLLLDNGANVDIQDNNGVTALVLSVNVNFNPTIAQLLIYHGANIHHIFNDKSILDYVLNILTDETNNSWFQLCKLLIIEGAKQCSTLPIIHNTLLKEELHLISSSTIDDYSNGEEYNVSLSKEVEEIIPLAFLNKMFKKIKNKEELTQIQKEKFNTLYSNAEIMSEFYKIKYDETSREEVDFLIKEYTENNLEVSINNKDGNIKLNKAMKHYQNLPYPFQKITCHLYNIAHETYLNEKINLYSFLHPFHAVIKPNNLLFKNAIDFFERSKNLPIEIIRLIGSFIGAPGSETNHYMQSLRNLRLKN